MDSLIDKNLLYDTRRGFYTTFLSVKMIQLLEEVYPDILKVDLTRQVEQMIDNVETYDDLQAVAKRGRDIVTDVVYKLKEVKDNDDGR